MNKLLKVLILLLIYTGLYAQPWKFNISLEKIKYFEGEPIYLLVSLENISNIDYDLTYLSSGGTYKIILRDANGNIIPDPNEVSNRQLVEKIDMTFKPNEAQVFIRAISREFGNSFFKRDMLPHLKVGKYTVKLRFEDLLIKNKFDTLRKKYLYSNELAFEVISPDPFSKIVLDKFINIYENRFEMGWTSYFHNAIRLIKKNITNPYVTMISYYIRGGNLYKYNLLNQPVNSTV